VGEGVTVSCPHGDPTCPCQDNGRLEADGSINTDPCHYQGPDAWPCPTTGLALGHCHIEGCTWRVVSGWSDGQRVEGECGLLKLGLPPATELDGEPLYSMTQARPGLPGWACGWLRSPGNEASRA
jgi:hypothetical protein